MKRASKVHDLKAGQLLQTAVFTLALVLSLTLFAGCFSIVSYAASAGRVTSASGANVRSSASSSASVVTSYAQNETISIRSQIQASDGYTWYEVHVDADTLGYIRSDLVEITDGSTPPSSTQVAPESNTTTTTNTTTATNDNPASVTAVNPVSATVVNGGSGGVRIRSNASTNGQIVTTVQNGLALTVTGQAGSADGDGKVWYQVNFISNGTEVSGFIRSDFVELSEEPTPYTEPAEVDPAPVDDAAPVDTIPQETKPYDTILQDGEWTLVMYETDPPSGYVINDLLRMVSGNEEVFKNLENTVRNQKIIIVIVVILLVVAVGAIGFLVFRIKDMMDSAYYNQVEKETLRRRSSQGGQRVTRDVGPEKRAPGQGQRPAGARPAGSSQGQRPASPQGQRPAGSSQGQRPVSPQGQRPAGSSQGQRPAAPQGQRSAGNGQSQRPAAPQGQRPAGASSQGQRPAAPQGQARPKPKNFMADDDEFEFGFLNYNGEDEQE